MLRSSRQPILRRPNPFRRHLVAGLAATVFGLVPAGVSAQQHEAVARRLAEAVERGELSRDQANTMLNALRQSSIGERGEHAEAHRERGEHAEAHRERGDHAEAHREHGEHAEAHRERGEHAERAERNRVAERELDRMVSEGKLSAAQARERLARLRDGVEQPGQTVPREFSQREQPGRRDDPWQTALNPLRAAVERGLISPEEAQAKLREVHLHLEQAVMQRQLAKAVERGELTREQAEEKLRDVQAEMQNASRRSQMQSAEVRLRRMIEAGEISEQDAHAKLEELRTANAKQAGERPDWANIERRVEAAVERGDLTREEADAKYKELRKQMAADRDE